MNVVIIDDEKTKRITMTDTLKRAGYHVESFSSPIIALKYINQNSIDVVISDIRMPELDGFEVLEEIKQKDPRIAVIMITAYGTVESAVEAMKKGAYDYLTKPFSSDQLLMLLEKFQRYKNLEEENLSLKRKLEDRYSFHNIIGRSKVMQDLFEQIELIAKNSMSILIEGESGTGKEMVANAIHYNSQRKKGPFIKLSCAALTESLFESELFGHEKGSFTGAYKTKQGRFELANGGTLFLDDIDDIPISSQVKLLRVLQEKEFERVGGTSSLKVDVRIISATKIDLWQKVLKKEFREDLFYRLRVIPIKLPPLRKRKEDIPLLISHFLKKANKENLNFTPETIDVLSCYEWPGNVRQLENAIYRMVSVTKENEINRKMIPHDLFYEEINQGRTYNFDHHESISLDNILSEVEKEAIIWALKKADENQTKAAEILSLKRTTFRDKMKKYGLI